ncbi:MAG: DNA gyrase subunit A [Chloroflexi bacterium]|nr:DNA gyrase subunit A [Chloroflexota bacterium]HCU80717.1 DNA gyrase subunit A [Chloroflexota bacterium]
MEIGLVKTTDINGQMRDAYLDYAMSVIVARALPDVRDGLKPVHRRILYAMHDMGLRSNASYKKSARIVGEVLGKYHPHGDQAVYFAMARMAQDFSMRYTMVNGQGNFGSIDGDAPAAMRYTEAKLAATAEEMLLDIAKNTVDWGNNFDESLQEPLVLPARMPNLLLNGASGIAVGMSTNIPPHNLRELADAIRYLIDRDDILKTINKHSDKATSILTNKFGMSSQQAEGVVSAILYDNDQADVDDLEQSDSLESLAKDMGEASVSELMVFVKGPDFPTGGVIVGGDGIVAAYSTGKGKVVIRALSEIEEVDGSRHSIVITEIPYQLNKTSLIERIADLARSGRIKMISDLRDESDRNGMRIVVLLKRGAHPQSVLNQLYKYTSLQSSFSVQLLALVDGEPRLLSLRRALQLYISHRQEIITRRSQHDLDKARDRAHVLEGLLLAIADIDEVIQTIRQAKDAEVAREQLISKFNLSDIQAGAILDLQLRRLAALERMKIEDEYSQTKELIAQLEDLLAHPKKILGLIKDDLNDVVESHGDDRTTRIAYGASDILSMEDMVPDESVLVTITSRGFIKRMPPHEFRAQRRGGKGVIGQGMRDEDEIEHLFSARSLQTILFFSDKGKVYSQKAFYIPAARRTDKGVALHNILPLASEERITAAVPVPSFADAEFCTMVTRNGKTKRVALSQFEAVRPSGLVAIKLASDDVLGWVHLTVEEQHIIIITEQGQALRFNSNLVRSMGRAAAGVKAINLRKGDRIAGVVSVTEGGQLLVVTSNGYGKRTEMRQYNPKGRATMGVATISRTAVATVTGPIVAVRSVHPDDQITIISVNGQALRTKVEDIRLLGRATKGTRLINLKEGDTVASVARLAAAELQEAKEKNLKHKSE